MSTVTVAAALPSQVSALPEESSVEPKKHNQSMFSFMDNIGRDLINRSSSGSSSDLVTRNIIAIAFTLIAGQVFGAIRIAFNLLGLFYNLTIGPCMKATDRSNASKIRENMNSIVKGFLQMVPIAGSHFAAGYDKFTQSFAQYPQDKTNQESSEVVDSGPNMNHL